MYVLMRVFRVVLKLAVPYAGSEEKFVSSGGNWLRNFFLRSSKNAKGTRLPSSEGAMARYVSGAWDVGSLESDAEEEDGESAM